MLRFLARFLGYWLVAAALVAAVVDGATSIAASRLVLTPLTGTWATLAALLGSEAAAWPEDAVLALILSAPTVLALAAAGIFLLFAGTRRRRTSFGRGYAA